MSKGPEAFRTISEVASDLDLPQHVLRFWETRFGQIRPMKRGGGRRYYRPEDVDLLRGIRKLLYGEGYTIKGVQRILREQGPRMVIAVGQGEIVPAMGPVEADERDYGGGPDELNFVARATEGLDAYTEAEDEVFAEEAESDDAELAVYAPPQHQAAPSRVIVDRMMPPPAQNFAGDEMQRLKATLADLLECKRLLDQAR